MAALPPSLAEDIKAILSAPGVDLGTISAKRVRKELEGKYEGFDVKEHKAEVDTLTVRLFHEIKTEREIAAAKANKAAKRKRSPSAPPHANAAGAQAAPAPPTAQAKPARIQAKSDEDFARQLHAEINGRRASRNGAGPSPQTAQVGKGGKKAKKKSEAYVEDSGDDGEGDEKPAKKKRASNGGGGYNKEMAVSPALAELIGVNTCSRPQTVKKIWDYIKAHDLQDPSDKRQIRCDDKMKKVFNVDTVHMFTMNKLLGAHLFNPAEVVP